MIRRDTFTPEKRSWIMSRVKSGDTMPEITLRRLLWKRGLRYRVSTKNLPGKPDILFSRAKVAVFVDGEFWHGYKLPPERLDQMSEYWRQKIRGNLERDRVNNERLKEMGYQVLRFFEKDIIRNSETLVDQIENVLKSRTKCKH